MIGRFNVLSLFLDGCQVPLETTDKDLAILMNASADS
jgi:hypothetical protein